MSTLREHWFKISILILLIIVAGFIMRYTQEYMQQQNQLAIQQVEQQKEEKDRAFSASQKESCLAIYKQESSKWTNTTEWRYDADEDKCYIEYKESKPKTEAECDALYKDENGHVYGFAFTDYVLCTQGLFEKSF